MQNITVDSSYMKKDEMIAFMSKHNIEIINMIPTMSGYWRKLFKKILKNSMALTLCLEKLATLFYDCLRIFSY